MADDQSNVTKKNNPIVVAMLVVVVSITSFAALRITWEVFWAIVRNGFMNG